MPSLSILRRGLLVVAIGAALAISHVSFATAQTKSEGLAENCYYEIQLVVNKDGKAVKNRVVECD